MSASARKSMSPSHHDLDVHRSPLKASLPNRRDGGEDALINRVRAEFVEMQGFSPTLTQAIRLFHLTEAECNAVLSALVNEGFLLQSSDGRYRLGRHR